MGLVSHLHQESKNFPWNPPQQTSAYFSWARAVSHGYSCCKGRLGKKLSSCFSLYSKLELGRKGVGEGPWCLPTFSLGLSPERGRHIA